MFARRNRSIQNVIIVGAGGHARVLAEALRASGKEISGYVSPEGNTASGNMAGLVRLGSDDVLLKTRVEGVVLVNGIGKIGNSTERLEIFQKYHGKGYSFCTVVHPSAVVASDVSIGEGGQIMASAVLQVGVRIGVDSIVNTAATVDHDAVVGDHCHVAPGGRLAGGVTIGNDTHVGIGATVIQNIHIGAGVTIGAGAVVVQNVPDQVIVRGVPGRF